MLSTQVWPEALANPGPLCVRPHPRGLLALTAPEEPPIFSSSRKDNLESSWAGLAGGGPSFSHP